MKKNLSYPDYYEYTISQNEVKDAIDKMTGEIPESVDKNHPIARCGPCIYYYCPSSTYNRKIESYNMIEKQWRPFWNWSEK